MDAPNVIVMLMDNLGYGDLGCYGSRQHRTAHIDRLAFQGMRFTSFYSVSGVCTPSRAGLMTGCYPRRVNLHIGGHGHSVLLPVDPKGLNPDEITPARLLREQGYATICVGKWHLGDQIPFLPTRHGFESFFGCPYSEDMVPSRSRPDWPPLPLMRDEEVIEAPADRDTLTKRYTEQACDFIRANRDRPFFLYLAHAMPGSTDRPFARPEFQGRSANGPYGDAIEELDWSCGEIMRILDELRLSERTLVVWTSDNGAVRWNPPQGSNAPLRGWGYDTSEGGQRVPCIVRWPGRVPANVVEERVATMMDIFPTAARLVGTHPPADRIIDGHDISSILFGDPRWKSPYDDPGFFYYHTHQLQAVRAGQWKLYLPLRQKLKKLCGKLDEGCESANAELYDVRTDIAETRDVSSKHPEVVERLSLLADRAREDIGDWNREGKNQRQAGWVADPQPRLLR